jgi:hypothetical protein
VVLTTHPNLSQRLKEEYSYNSTPNLGLRGLFWGKIRPSLHPSPHPQVFAFFLVTELNEEFMFGSLDGRI